MHLSQNQKIPIFNNFYRTKEWWIFLSTFLFIFIPLLLIWLFYGEFNLSNLNWLIAKNQCLWHGRIEAKNIDELSKKFGDYYEGGSDALRIELLSKIGKNQQILSNLMKFNNLIFIPCIVMLVWAIIYPIFLYFLKVSNLDIIPFSFTIALAGNGVIFTNLIPHYNYFFLVRIFIIFICFLLSFILSNYFVNKIIINIASIKKQKNKLFCYFPNDEKKVYFNDLQKKIMFWKKSKKDDKVFVETKGN